MQVQSRFEIEILILKRLNNDIFTNVGNIGIDISLPVKVGQARKICHCLRHKRIALEKQGIQMNGYH